MRHKAKVVINQTEIKEIQKMRDKNDKHCKEDDEVNNFYQHNSLRPKIG